NPLPFSFPSSLFCSYLTRNKWDGLQFLKRTKIFGTSLKRHPFRLAHHQHLWITSLHSTGHLYTMDKVFSSSIITCNRILKHGVIMMHLPAPMKAIETII